MGFEFVEFVVFDLIVLYQVFFMMGFIRVVSYCFKVVSLYCQGSINFIFNSEFGSVVFYFVSEYGFSVCGMVFCVRDLYYVYVCVLLLGV